MYVRRVCDRKTTDLKDEYDNKHAINKRSNE